MKYLIVLLSVLILTSCGGGSANVQPEAPSITSKSVSGNSLVYYYSDGSSISKTISSYTDTWATDHVTRTRNYILADNSTEYIQETITPTNSTSKTTSEKTTTTTYGDGHVDTITSPATSGRTATTDNITGITQWTNYLDGDWRQKFYAFTWSNYANFGDLPNHDNHGIGFNTLGSSRQLTQISGQGWVETHDGGFPSDNNIFLTYDPTTSDISFLSVRPETSSISISNWNKTRVNATSSVFGEFDFLEYSDIKFLFHNSYKHRYEHLVFGAWAEVNDGSTAEYGAFFGPKRTRMVSAVIPASGSYSFVGKMVGAFDSSIYRLMHANLSSTVDFAAGTVHISTTSAQYLDSSLGWIADSNLNLSGTAAIGGDGNFSGSVTFNNSSTGTLFGSFYGGASVENMGGLIQKDDKSLKASFGAVKQ